MDEKVQVREEPLTPLIIPELLDRRLGIVVSKLSFWDIKQTTKEMQGSCS